MSHTPTPWTYNHRLADDGDKSTEVYGKSKHLNEPVCIIPHDDITDKGYEEVKANAAFIVRAVNSHEALVYALKQFINGYELRALAEAGGDDEPNPDLHHYMPKCLSEPYKLAMDALAKVEAKP